MVPPPPLPKSARLAALRELQKRIGYGFEDLALLDRALTHASTGNQGKANYERLEFLGDAFLNFAVAHELFRREPEIPEGRLTEVRAALVSRSPLAAIARKLHLIRHLEVGKGLRESELYSERILADLVEAVLGAVLIDGGVQAARRFVRRHVLAGNIEKCHEDRPPIDSKTRLLHHCQRQGLGQPRYETVETRGLQHDQTFVVAVKLRDGRSAEGQGRTKRAAEKDAAESLLGILNGRKPTGA
ncbi:MAG: ribonuclease III [Planctomycetota bacterium]